MVINFKKVMLFSLLTLFMTYLAPSVQAEDKNPFPKVKMETSMGTITLELDRNKAPLTVENFLSYVANEDYNNTIFHRIIKNFVVQGGGLTPDFKTLKENTPIANESGNGLTNDTGTIAMARSLYPHSATRQFYFNLTDNNQLNPSSMRWGYAVFGEIIEGMDVLNAISQVPTGYNQQINQPNVPLTSVILKKVTLVK